MLLRSFLQLIALLLFSLVFVTVLLLLSAYAGYLGGDARVWVEWGWAEAIARRELIEEVFALAGAIGTLTISALGVYKSWHFAELNLPARLEDLSRHWTRAINASRPAVVPELRLETISFAPPRSRGFVGKLSALVYDPDQAALRRCTKKVSKFEAELRALGEGQRRCQKEIATRYLELGSLLKRCDPDAGQGALNLFKKGIGG